MSLQQKIEYDLWANKKVLHALQSVKETEVLAEITRLFAHLFKAQIIWYNRVQGINEEIEIWGSYTLEDCASLLNDSHTMLEGVAAKAEEVCEYQNSKGLQFTNKVSDIFEQLIIHGQHHRAQIFMILRKAGYTPPTTDYIFYVRQL